MNYMGRRGFMKWWNTVSAWVAANHLGPLASWTRQRDW